MTHQEAVDTLAAERYLLNDMSNDDRQTYEEHFFACDVCADDLRSAAAMLQGAKDGFAGASTASRVVPMAARSGVARARAWYQSVALPWAAAAALAGVAAYQSLWLVPSLQRDASPIVLAPVTLRPESRGAEPIVRARSRTAPVTLALEINDPPQGGEISYELNTSDGRHIASGRTTAPAPETPLLLLLPPWTLTGSMHYILSVRDASASGRSLGEYRFAVSMP